MLFCWHWPGFTPASRWQSGPTIIYKSLGHIVTWQWCLFFLQTLFGLDCLCVRAEHLTHFDTLALCVLGLGLIPTPATNKPNSYERHISWHDRVTSWVQSLSQQKHGSMNAMVSVTNRLHWGQVGGDACTVTFTHRSLRMAGSTCAPVISLQNRHLGCNGLGCLVALPLLRLAEHLVVLASLSVWSQFLFNEKKYLNFLSTK